MSSDNDARVKAEPVTRPASWQDRLEARMTWSPEDQARIVADIRERHRATIEAEPCTPADGLDA